MLIFLSIVLAVVVLVVLLLSILTADRASSVAWASTAKWTIIVLTVGIAAIVVVDRLFS